MAIQRFAAIQKRAVVRKGGAAALAALLPPPADPNTLRNLPDDRALAEMARRVFSAGFVWKVIEAKWPGFEAAFLGFDPVRLNFEPDEFWERLTGDERIVRHAAKIMSVRANARFVLRHGSRARQLRQIHRRAGRRPTWSACSNSWASAARASAVLTGQCLLSQFLGKDGFMLNKDVIAIACATPAWTFRKARVRKRNCGLIQDQFNAWAEEIRPFARPLSRICAMSISENYAGVEKRRGISRVAGAGSPLMATPLLGRGVPAETASLAPARQGSGTAAPRPSATSGTAGPFPLGCGAPARCAGDTRQSPGRATDRQTFMPRSTLAPTSIIARKCAAGTACPGRCSAIPRWSWKTYHCSSGRAVWITLACG